MTTKEIRTVYNQIISALDKRELKTAFDLLSRLIETPQAGLFRDELDELQQTHKQMLHYFVTGTTDPMRKKIFSGLITSVYELTDKITQKICAVDSPEMVYAIRRMASVYPERISQLTDKVALAYETDDKKLAESLLVQLFKSIWTAGFLSSDDMNSLQQALLDTKGQTDRMDDPSAVKCQIISALIIGLQLFFDKRKMLLLLRAAGSHDDEVKIRAYIGILLTLFRYQQRIDYYTEIKNHIDLLSENDDFIKTVYLIILRFILSRDTEKITSQMRDEILPEMMKLHPEIDPSSKGDTLEFFEFEMNPEWMEKFENSPLGKKMEEFSRLQEEGADVMLFSFVNLKHFPFFNELSHWFLPFYYGMSFLSQETAVSNTMGMMTEAGIMCNSDLYSFYFSINHMFDEGHLAMIEKLESQLCTLKDQKKSEMQTRVTKAERIIGHYIQDLYRFCKLHPRRQEFFDIFTLSLDFHNLPVLQGYFADKDDLLNIAEYYLRKNYFDDALVLYTRLSDVFAGDEMLYQKKGYCRQLTGDYNGALEDYEKAELINADSKWLLRRIAQCYRAVGKPEKALGYYLRLEKIEPENRLVLSNIGACYLDLKHYADALNYYFKVDYLDHESGKSWRPIAWCSFLMGRYEQARNYYLKILSSNPGYQDYANVGHAEWALGNQKNAYDYYLKSIRDTPNNFDLFLDEFKKDIPALIAAGIDTEEIAFMLDQIRYVN